MVMENLSRKMKYCKELDANLMQLILRLKKFLYICFLVKLLSRFPLSYRNCSKSLYIVFLYIFIKFSFIALLACGTVIQFFNAMSIVIFHLLNSRSYILFNSIFLSYYLTLTNVLYLSDLIDEKIFKKYIIHIGIYYFCSTHI